MKLRFNHSTEYDESTQPEGEVKKSSITEFTGRSYPRTKRESVAIRDIYVTKGKSHMCMGFTLGIGVQKNVKIFRFLKYRMLLSCLYKVLMSIVSALSACRCINLSLATHTFLIKGSMMQLKGTLSLHLKAK